MKDEAKIKLADMILKYMDELDEEKEDMLEDEEEDMFEEKPTKPMIKIMLKSKGK